MKALPKRKENTAGYRSATQPAERLNESPYEKEGKFVCHNILWIVLFCLNESPSEKEGKSALAREGMLGESDPQ